MRVPAADSYACADRTKNNKGDIDHPVKGEQYCVAPAGKTEEEAFYDLGDQINKIQNHIALKDGGGKAHRGFHAHHHGCLIGTMTINEGFKVPAGGNAGLFVPGRKYKIIARFSNASSEFGAPDTATDARGLAIKVLGTADGRWISEVEPTVRTQDFLMTNQASANGKDAYEFMAFAGAVNGSLAAKVKFFATHPRVDLVVKELLQNKVYSVASENYWAKTPFRFGPDLAVKFLVRPWAKKIKADRTGADYLTEDLKARAATDRVGFGFYVQYQGDDAKAFPVEDGLHVWNEKVSVPVRAAEIEFYKQNFATPERQQFCEALEFTPWHNLKAHEPIGNLNRGRRVVYSTSQSLRQGGDEPTVTEVQKYFGEFKDQ